MLKQIKRSVVQSGTLWNKAKKAVHWNREHCAT